MVSGITKKVVVIRDIPSNMIEEAILILKSEPESKDNAGNKNSMHINKSSDHLLKEAEMIIRNYVKENRLYIESSTRGGKKRGIKKWMNINLFINIMLAGSIIFLILMVIKLL